VQDRKEGVAKLEVRNEREMNRNYETFNKGPKNLSVRKHNKRATR